MFNVFIDRKHFIFNGTKGVTIETAKKEVIYTQLRANMVF